MKAREKTNRLTIAEAIRLNSWLEANKERVKTDTFPGLAASAKQALGFDLTPSNIDQAISRGGFERVRKVQTLVSKNSADKEPSQPVSAFEFAGFTGKLLAHFSAVLEDSAKTSAKVHETLSMFREFLKRQDQVEGSIREIASKINTNDLSLEDVERKVESCVAAAMRDSIGSLQRYIDTSMSNFDTALIRLNKQIGGIDRVTTEAIGLLKKQQPDCQSSLDLRTANSFEKQLNDIFTKLNDEISVVRLNTQEIIKQRSK